MSGKPIEVPMQPYAGQLLLIEQLIMPDCNEESLLGIKTTFMSKSKSMPRLSYFEPRFIEKTLIKYCTLESMPKLFKDELILDILAAVETYMKHMITTVVELCEHRSGNTLYSDPRCVMQHNMRTTMMFLNDREVADYGCSDDDSAFGHRRRWVKLQRNRNSNAVESEMRLESTNNTAMLALGARKSFAAPVIGAPAAPAQPPQRSFVIRIKHVNVKDVIQFMEDNKRYAKSKLLFDAYLTYKW